MGKFEFVKGIDYTIEDGKVVMTEAFHIKRGKCCGNSCKNCPYVPKSIRGNKVLTKLD